MLDESVKINGYKNRVNLFQKAAFDQITKLQFTWRTNRLMDGHIVLPDKVQKVGNVVQVDTVLLDDIAIVDVPINLIKIDVEGAEPFVINGAKKILDNSPEIKIILEWNIDAMKNLGVKIEKLTEALKSYDFKVEKIQRIGYRTGRLDPIDLDELVDTRLCNILLSK